MNKKKNAKIQRTRKKVWVPDIPTSEEMREYTQTAFMECSMIRELNKAYELRSVRGC